jgi:hypothetical protein
MKNRKSPGLYFAVFVMVSLFAGCSAIVGKFEGVKKSGDPDSQALSSPGVKKPIIKKSAVYFYRPDQSISGWTWKDIDIMEIHVLGIITDPDEKSQVSHVGKLKNNSYIKEEFNPGIHRFTANWELIPYVFTIKPNEDLCIKAEIGLVNALRHRATLKKIDKSVCESDMEMMKEYKEKDWYKHDSAE